MTIKAKLTSSTNYNVKVTPSAQSLQTGAPIALRNIATDLDVKDLAEIGNVSVINKTDGAGLQYNSVTNKYEVKLLDIDGGSF